jgi:hypothetical protein
MSAAAVQRGPHAAALVAPGTCGACGGSGQDADGACSTCDGFGALEVPCAECGCWTSPEELVELDGERVCKRCVEAGQR